MPSPESLSPRLSSVESLRSSIPEEHRKLFDSLQQDIKDYCEAHGLPAPSLTSREAFITAAQKNRTPPDVLNHIILLLKRFDYLTEHKKPMPEKSENLEYADKYYRLSEQYNQQVSLLREVGILHTKGQTSQKITNLSDLFRSLFPFGKKKRSELPKEAEGTFFITGIDGKEYPIPTLEQIALRLYERREELSSKHDQGFTKLLLVPFGMSLSALLDTLKHFLLSYKQQHPDFKLDTAEPLWAGNDYKKADTATDPDGSPFLAYYHPTSFDSKDHQGKTKAQILSAQFQNPSSFPGWIVHLFQPSNPEDQDSPGIAPIPREGKGTSYGQDTPYSLDPSTPSRPDLEANKTPREYLSILQSSQDNPDSSYHLETGLTPEDWIIAFMTHLQETGQPLDNFAIGTQSGCLLTGAFFPSSTSPIVLYMCWYRGLRQAGLVRNAPDYRSSDDGSRSSVMI
jgi:hypothetical protein